MTPDQVEEIKANPYKEDFPLLSANTDLAFLDSAATAQRPACVLESQRSFYETMNANALRGLYRLSVEATGACFCCVVYRGYSIAGCCILSQYQ